MDSDERNILLCMTGDPRSPAAIAETVAELTGARYTKSYVMVTFFRLVRMTLQGLVTMQGSGDPMIPPMAHLTKKGLEAQAELVAENSELQLRVFCAHLYTRPAYRASAH
ncbi:MAG: hypothetical protein AAB919_02945 [Patescibacteria group bacterium]